MCFKHGNIFIIGVWPDSHQTCDSLINSIKVIAVQTDLSEQKTFTGNMTFLTQATMCKTMEVCKAITSNPFLGAKTSSGG